MKDLTIDQNEILFGNINNNEIRRIDMSSPELETTGATHESTHIHEGQTLLFPDFEDMIIEEIPIAKGSKSKALYVRALDKDSKKTVRFCLSVFMKTDIDGTPLFPGWRNLGNNKARLEKLAEIGELTGTILKEIEVPVFKDGHRLYEPVLNVDGTFALDDKNVQKKVLVTKKKHICMFKDVQ